MGGAHLIISITCFVALFLSDLGDHSAVVELVISTNCEARVEAGCRVGKQG